MYLTGRLRPRKQRSGEKIDHFGRKPPRDADARKAWISTTSRTAPENISGTTSRALPSRMFIGGTIDLFRLFRDLEHREADALDNGQVDGNVSLADRERFAKPEAEQKKKIKRP